MKTGIIDIILDGLIVFIFLKVWYDYVMVKIGLNTINIQVEALDKKIDKLSSVINEITVIRVKENS